MTKRTKTLQIVFFIHILFIGCGSFVHAQSDTTITSQLNKRYFPPFALKSNLLFDISSALNFELEVPIGTKWSVNGEWVFPWWLHKSNKYCLEAILGTVEGRYWFGDRDKRVMLSGFFAGIYAGGGLYDLQWLDKGYQGEFFVASGVSGGYTFNIGKNFNLELSLGVGYLVTNYRYYIPKEDYTILAYQYDGRFTWIGPTKAKVSLCWLIGQKYYNKKGK